MSQIPNPFGMNRSTPWEMEGTSNPAIVRFFNSVYAWMSVGLAVTAMVAYFVAESPQLAAKFQGNWWILLIVELGLVMVISGAINRINANVATLLFVLYAAINDHLASVIDLDQKISPIYHAAKAFVEKAFSQEGIDGDGEVRTCIAGDDLKRFADRFFKFSTCDFLIERTRDGEDTLVRNIALRSVVMSE